MNDFIKEELQEILDSFDWIEGETSWEWKHPLRNKIQSMIDNYYDYGFDPCYNKCNEECRECECKDE